MTSLKSIYLAAAMALPFVSASAQANDLQGHLTFLHDKLAHALPMVVDDYTALTSVSIAGDTFVRTFTIDVPPESVNGVEFGQSMEPSLIGYVCNTENQQRLLELGGQYRFVYEAQDMFPLFSIDIGAADCPNN